MTSSAPIDPVVDHLADMALREAELAATPVAADPLQMVSPSSPGWHRCRTPQDVLHRLGARRPR